MVMNISFLNEKTDTCQSSWVATHIFTKPSSLTTSSQLSKLKDLGVFFKSSAMRAGCRLLAVLDLQLQK